MMMTDTSFNGTMNKPVWRCYDVRRKIAKREQQQVRTIFVIFFASASLQEDNRYEVFDRGVNEQSGKHDAGRLPTPGAGRNDVNGVGLTRIFSTVQE